MKDDFSTDRLEQVAQTLRAAAVERGMHITADGRVSEVDAASLLELSPPSLKGLRLSFCGPAHYYRGAGNGSRISYRFDDLAAWLESFRQAS